jgi:hypothetical protein
VKALAALVWMAAAAASGWAFSADTPPAAPSPAAAPRIVVEPMSFEFGTVRAGRAVQKEFLVRNHGRSDLVIHKIVSSCGCTAALTDSQTLKPGASTPLRVTFTAPEEPGRLQKSVLLQTNDPVRPTLELKIEATVAAPKKR